MRGCPVPVRGAVQRGVCVAADGAAWRGGGGARGRGAGSCWGGGGSPAGPAASRGIHPGGRPCPGDLDETDRDQL